LPNIKFIINNDFEIHKQVKISDKNRQAPPRGGGGTCSHDPLIFLDFIPCSPLIKPLVPKNVFSSCSLDPEIFLRCSLDPQKCLSLFPIFVSVSAILNFATWLKQTFPRCLAQLVTIIISK
jgi:hypothetical protein